MYTSSVLPEHRADMEDSRPHFLQPLSKLLRCELYGRDLEPCDRATSWADRSPVVLESAAMRAESMRVAGDLHCLLRRMRRLIAMSTEEPRRDVLKASFAAVSVSVTWETFPLIPQHACSADPSRGSELQMAMDALLQVNHSAPPSPREQVARVRVAPQR